MTDWIDVEEAKALPGLRLVLTAGVPGPWGEAAKGVFRARGVPFASVRQVGGQPNDELFAWTGHRNAPVAMIGNERARTTWLELLLLAERLGSGPSLIPTDPADRALMFGLATELMGEGGYGWCRRLMLFGHSLQGAEEPPEPLRAALSRMLQQYDYSAEAARRAPERVAEILRLLSERLADQRARGHAYLMGPEFTALDVYWAAMAGITSPLPHDVCPMPESMRAMYAVTDPRVVVALDPALLAHRDLVYEKHLGLPVEL